MIGTVLDSPQGTGLDAQALRFLHEVGGLSFVAEMIELFRSHTPPKLDEARNALAAGQVETVSMFAHSLKSSAAQLGCPDLAEACRRLELATVEAATRDTAEMARLLAGVEAEFERVLPLLAAHIAAGT